MAIDFGTGNTTRYYSIPDSPDFILPNGDWTWLALVNSAALDTQSSYIVSTGDWGAVNSFNLYTYGTANGISLRVSTLGELITPSAPLVNGTWYWVFATRASGVLNCGQIALAASAVTESSGLAISAAYDSATGPQIGRRAAGLVRNWNGKIGQVAFVSGYSVTDTQLVELAKGAPLLSMPFMSSTKFLFHGRTANDATIAELIGGKVLTKQGTGYGTAEEDAQTPYIWAPKYSRGTVSGVAAPTTTQVKVAGVWKLATVHTKVAGVWKVATPSVKVAGVWK